MEMTVKELVELAVLRAAYAEVWSIIKSDNFDPDKSWQIQQTMQVCDNLLKVIKDDKLRDEPASI